MCDISTLLKKFSGWIATALPIKPHSPTYQPSLFFGTDWPHRSEFRQASAILPNNSCLLAADRRNKKQVEIMKRVAQARERQGQSVFIWLTSRQGR
ncbi:MAG: hypothetical protein AAF485_20905 [Chloroflexota bacterium]